jgi:soluble lytic murein transglycosylase-like protein
VYAGQQREEPLSASVRSLLQRSVADSATDRSGFQDRERERDWLDAMAPRLAARLPDPRQREELLRTVHYEATRAGLEPELVLSVIQVESAFRKYAVSTVGARGFMQVMPFWLRDIGTTSQDLFHLRTNLRFGCTILRYYVDQERGDLYRALGRYNGSLGQPEYPGLVLKAWRRDWGSIGLTTTALAR